MSKDLTTSGFKWIHPEQFESSKYSSNSSKWCVLEVYYEYPKELHELHIDYLLVLDKIEIKRKILSNYWLKMSDVYIDPIGTADK